MGFLEKWNPAREMDRFRREFDDLIDRFGFDRDFFGGRERHALEPAIETCIEDGKFIVRTDLPGIDPKDVDIKVVGDLLTIKGSREDKSETRKGDYFRREIRYGSFERAVTLPAGVKADDLKAAYRNGVLELSAPMPKEAAPREVKIQVEGAEHKKVESENKPKAA